MCMLEHGPSVLGSVVGITPGPQVAGNFPPPHDPFWKALQEL